MLADTASDGARAEPNFLVAHDNNSDEHEQRGRLTFPRKKTARLPTDRVSMPRMRSVIERLNVEWFRTLREACVLMEQWRLDFNAGRPHSSHG